MSVRSSNSRRSVSSVSSSASSTGFEINQMINIEKRYPQFIEKKIEELEKLKSLSSEKHEFDQFIALESYINFRKKENTTHVIAIFKKWLQEGINEAAGNFDFNINQIMEQHRDQKQIISTEYERSLNQLKEKQSKEIEKLNTIKTSEIDREKQRRPSDVRKLLNLSQKYAQANETELAKEARNEAFSKQKIQFEKKQIEIEQKYKQMVKQIRQKYQNDSEAVKMKYKIQLDLIKNQYLVETNEQKKRLLVFIQYLQQRAITEGSKELLRKEKKLNFVKEITSYVSNHVFDIGKGFLFDGIES